MIVLFKYSNDIKYIYGKTELWKIRRKKLDHSIVFSTDINLKYIDRKICEYKCNNIKYSFIINYDFDLYTFDCIEIEIYHIVISKYPNMSKCFRIVIECDIPNKDIEKLFVRYKWKKASRYKYKRYYLKASSRFDYMEVGL